MKKILFIGPYCKKGVPRNGASVKNSYTINRMRELGLNVKAIDTENWRKNPLILLNVLIALIFSFGREIIISTSFRSAYSIIRLASRIVDPKRIIYWVIGGALAEKIKDNNFSENIYKRIKLLIVEGEGMAKQLGKLGINNTIVLPNFKKLSKLPIISGQRNEKFQFVFLSRIIPEKGCELILESCRVLNSKGLENKYAVSFYGPVDEKYKEKFSTKVNELNNVSYKGFLDLREWSNYNELAEYDCMLFPTFWPTEGFPGIVVDAMIAGLPVIATDWNMNSELIIEGKNGWLVKPEDLQSLVKAMERVILNRDMNEKMRHSSRNMVDKYNVDKILTTENLHKIGL